MSKTRSLKMKGLSLLVAVAMAVAALPLVATPALATEPEYKMFVVAEPATVTPGQTFTATVMMDSPEAGGGLMSAQFSKFTFDHNVVQIESMEAGAAWAGANFMGASQAKIDEANGDGTLEAAVAAFFLPGAGPAPHGEQEFVIINMKAKEGIVGTHTVPLAVSDLYMLNALLESKTPTGTDGQVVVEGPVVDFSLAVVPDAATVPAGEAATVIANVTATLVTGSTGDVALTYSLPADVEGITVTFAPDLGQPTFTSAMTINVTGDATPGTHAITIIGGMVETTTFTLEVEEAFDFSLAVDPTAATVTRGAEVTANVTATLVAGDTEDVELTSSLPAGVAGITVTFAPAVHKPDFTSTMTVAAADATLGEHVITITGTSVGGVAKTVPFTLTVVEEALPQAIALTPDRGGPGTEVTVEGEGFPVETLGIVFAIEAGGFGGEWLVSFGGIEGLALLPASVITPIPFDTDEHGKFTVTATILPNAPPGEVTFVANVAGVVATAPFTVFDPTIALTPTSGCGGTEVTITGEWFEPRLLGYVSAKNDSTGEDVIHPVPFRSDEHGSFEVQATILPDAPLGPATFAAMEAEEVIVTASFEVTDLIPPTVEITSTAADPTNVSPIPMTATFSEDVTGFGLLEITVGNGAAGNFTAVSGSVYTFDVTPDADGLVTVDIAAGVATDAAGNPNEAAPQFSITYDSAAPTVVITSTASDPTNVSPIPMTATFSEDVTGFELLDIAVGNGTAGNFTAVSGSVYTFDVTPDADGLVTVDIAAGVATDAAGNPNEAAPQFSITYDSAAPTVVITSTASDPTNVSPIPMTTTFSEEVTGFELLDIAVGNGTAGNFTAVSGREYTFDVTPAADGVVTVDIAAGVATDAAGNHNEAAPQFSITYDTTPPDDGWPPELRIAGSTTVKKIADETAGVFAENWPNTTMNVMGGGSSHGISQIKAGNVGIGMSSRELTEAEKQGLHVYTIARDAVCIVVRDSAAMAFVDDITRDQLKQIYEAGANITAMKWSDLNPAWPEELIVPRARIVGSGTRDTLHDLADICDTAEEATIVATGLPRLDGNQDVVDAIKENDYQIGYVGLGFIDQPGIRVLKVEGVMPSVATVQDGTYPMSRDLYMLTLAEGAESNARADDFINYMFTAAGQAHVAAAGFVSVPIPADPPIRDYDVNKDNEVSVADVTLIMGHWDETSGHHGWIRADVNKDGKVSVADVTPIMWHWDETWPDPTWP